MAYVEFSIIRVRRRFDGQTESFRGDPPRDRTENILIKSQAFFVHRRTQQFTAGTILRLKAKIVPTVQK